MKKTVKQNRFDTRSMVLCALFAALSAAGAYIRIPLGIVPITMQFFFTNLAGLLLGKRNGLISVGLYIFIGLIGIPIFTQGGGPAYILKPTFGYLVGMALGAYAAGYIVEKRGSSYVNLILAGLAGMVAVYAIGVTFFGLISNFYIGQAISINTLLVSCCLVFLPGDVLSAVLGAVLAKRLLPVLKTGR